VSGDVEWETLNAYVDGELTPAETAQVAEQLAQDPGLARRVAELSRLKSTLFDLRQPCPEPIRLKPAGYRRRGLVAALFLFMALFSGWQLFEERALPPDLVAQAVVAHNGWLSGGHAEKAGASGELLKSSLKRLQLDAYVPDLSRAGLSYDGIRPVSFQSQKGLHVGYRGPHGCRVSLVVFKDDSRRSGKAIDTFAYGGYQIYGWQVRGAAYYLLAPRMDPQRLQQIARVVQRMTRSHRTMDGRAMMALQQARDASTPCVV
jgi:anti-sigma factor RsiW